MNLGLWSFSFEQGFLGAIANIKKCKASKDTAGGGRVRNEGKGN